MFRRSREQRDFRCFLHAGGGPGKCKCLYNWRQQLFWKCRRCDMLWNRGGDPRRRRQRVRALLCVEHPMFLVFMKCYTWNVVYGSSQATP